MSNTSEILSDVLSKIAKERSLANSKITIHPITSDGANYSSQIFLANIDDGATELKLFAKVSCIGEKMREQLPMPMFQTEINYYTKLAKAYEELQDRHNIPEDKRYTSPEYYGSSNKEYEETLVLEDLIDKGYLLYDRFKSVDWTYASRSVEELAKFHALSIALMKDNKEVFDELSEHFPIKWHEGMNTMLLDLMQNTLPVLNEENRIQVTTFLKTHTFDIDEFNKPVRINVMGHGDYRASNQMYKVDAVSTCQVVTVSINLFLIININNSVFVDIRSVRRATDKVVRFVRELATSARPSSSIYITS